MAENAEARRKGKAQGIYSLSEAEYLEFVQLSILAGRTMAADAGSATSAPSAVPPVAWKNEGQIVMGMRSELDLEDLNNRTNWRRDRRMGSYHNVRGQGSAQETGESSELKVFLAQAAADTRVLEEESGIEFLAREIGGKVCDFMLKPGEEVDINVSLSQVGLDALMATELRRWFRQALGIQVSVLEMMMAGSLAQLAGGVAGGLQTKLTSGSAS